MCVAFYFFYFSDMTMSTTSTHTHFAKQFKSTLLRSILLSILLSLYKRINHYSSYLN